METQGYLHDHERWHMYMRGLMQLISLSGGQENLHPSIVVGVKK